MSGRVKASAKRGFRFGLLPAVALWAGVLVLAAAVVAGVRPRWVTAGAAAGAVLGLGWVGLRALRRQLRLIDRLSEAMVEAGANGGLCKPVPVEGGGEVTEVVRAFNAMTRRIAEDTARLRESEERSRLILDGALDAVVAIDAQGRVVGWNAQAEAVFGWLKGEVVGRKLSELIVPPQHRGAHERGLRRYLETGSGRVVGRRIEITALRRGGEEFPVELAITVVGSGPGAVFSAFLRDISRRKRAEEELQAQVSQQEAVAELGRYALSGASLPELMKKLVELVAQTLRVEYAKVLEHLPKNGCLLLRAGVGWGEGVVGRTTVEDGVGSQAGYTLRSEGPVIVEDLRKEVRFNGPPLLHDHGVVSGLSVIIPGEGRPWGVLGAHTVRRREFTKRDVLFLEAMAGLAWAALARQRVEEELRRQAEDLMLTKGDAERQAIELSRRTEQLERARAEAEAADRAKSEFLANMSHEIRTPMTAILGYVDLLGEPNLGLEGRMNYVQIIRRNGEHLLAIINDILDLSKIEAGKMRLELVECSVHEVVAEVASLMRERARQKGIAFEAEFVGPIPRAIRSDPTRLRQVLINLVGNAIKFTESGGVRLVVRRGAVREGGGSTIVFEVIDTGVGIAEEQVARLFQRFAQADASTTRRFGGTGLGLTIAKRLAEMLGGGIVVKSTLGEGSSFVATIDTGPLEGVEMVTDPREALAGLSVQGPAEGEVDAKASLVGARVLLAEDGPDNQRLISYVLRRAGAEVAVAEDGVVAVDKAERAKEAGEPFDVILMDMQMPLLDGYGAVRALRERGYLGAIVALTAHAMEEERKRCLEGGCDDYASKPIDKGKLLALVARYARAAGRRQGVSLEEWSV